MELVNNYFSGSARTVTFGPGGPGYSSDNESSGTGSIEFSTLIAEKSAAGCQDTNSNVSDQIQNGPSRGKEDTVKASVKQTTKQTAGQTTGETDGQTDEIDNSDEMKARAEGSIAALSALVSAMEADRITSEVNTGVKFVTEDDQADLSVLVSAVEADRITPEVNTGVGNVAENDTAALNALLSTMEADRITPEVNVGVGNVAENDTAALNALLSTMEADRITPEVNVGVGNVAENDIAALNALVSTMEADRITPEANTGVEIVRERLVTEAKAPNVAASAKASDNSGGPVAVMQESAPAEDGRSVTLSERNFEDTETANKATETERKAGVIVDTKTENLDDNKAAANKAAMETERNGSAITDSKTENVVDNIKTNSVAADNKKGNVDDTKMSPEEILKSLEGQGHIISNSGSYPKGEPSTDPNGPTGRPNDGTLAKAEKAEKGPGVSKTKTNTEEKTETNTAAKTETVEDQAAAVPVGFATQTQKTTAQQQELPVGTNETMMMRTSESTLTDDLTNLVSSRFPSKNGQLTIELDPENLGKITINVNYDSGHAAVSISATNNKTLEMLTKSAPQMANIIQQKTGQETSVFVPNTQQSGTKHDMADGRESNENREQQRSRQNEQQSRTDETSNTAFLQQMRLGLV